MGTRHLPGITDLRRNSTLAARGSLGRTFGSLAGFMILSLLGLGIYLIEEAVANPVEGTQVSVLAAGVILGFASVLLFYLLRPRR